MIERKKEIPLVVKSSQCILLITPVSLESNPTLKLSFEIYKGYGHDITMQNPVFITNNEEIFINRLKTLLEESYNISESEDLSSGDYDFEDDFMYSSGDYDFEDDFMYSSDEYY